ncbi:hypothetical protein EDB81DRAFT_497001 [Dactylonectria macrodidyma]|uniref:Secreted protein n=1 Tax=Dactylonectria macrodidyma TaxID=307937 RepID=A0A9P9EWR3_9HYPO|nr:hypothetical protein EDB81DRAFT_497001 [Dactylonectria macrodidyma]
MLTWLVWPLVFTLSRLLLVGEIARSPSVCKRRNSGELATRWWTNVQQTQRRTPQQLDKAIQKGIYLYYRKP